MTQHRRNMKDNLERFSNEVNDFWLAYGDCEACSGGYASTPPRPAPRLGCPTSPGTFAAFGHPIGLECELPRVDSPGEADMLETQAETIAASDETLLARAPPRQGRGADDHSAEQSTFVPDGARHSEGRQRGRRCRAGELCSRLHPPGRFSRGGGAEHVAHPDRDQRSLWPASPAAADA